MAPSTIVLITGANAGVGFATAKVIASASPAYHVIVTARTIQKAQGAVEELQATGELKGTVSALQLDVTDVPSVERAVKAVGEQFGRLDVLVNNGGIFYVRAPDGEMDKTALPEDAFKAVLETNVVGPYTTSRLFRQLLAKSADPRTIHVTSRFSSMALQSGMDGEYKPFGEIAIPYAASKAALNMLSLAEKRAVPGGLETKIFTMCPGLVVSNVRGLSEDAKACWGGAGDPAVSGHTILSIIEGKRDADEGKGTLHKDGLYPW